MSFNPMTLICPPRLTLGSSIIVDMIQGQYVYVGYLTAGPAAFQFPILAVMRKDSCLSIEFPLMSLLTALFEVPFAVGGGFGKYLLFVGDVIMAGVVRVQTTIGQVNWDGAAFSRHTQGS